MMVFDEPCTIFPPPTTALLLPATAFEHPTSKLLLPIALF